MPQSLRIRFNGQGEEIAEYARTFGIWKAMDKYEVRDYLAFSRFLKEQTGKDNTGCNPVFSSTNYSNLGDQLVNAFLSKITQLEDERNKLKEQIEQLEWQLNQHQAQEEMQALAVLQRCKA